MTQVLHLVLSQIKNVSSYIPKGCLWATGIVAFLFVSVMFFINMKNISYKRIPWWKFGILFLFMTYFYCMLQITLLSRYVSDMFGNADLSILVKWQMNDMEKAYFLSNIIMFVPMGVLLPMLFRWTKYLLTSLPVATALSVMIELIQLKKKIGYCQLDDVVANIIGFLIGYLGFVAIFEVVLGIKAICKIIVYKRLRNDV